MNSKWSRCVRHWITTCIQKTDGRKRRASGRRSSLLLIEQVQILEARTLLAADTDDQIREAINLGTMTLSATANGSIDTVSDEAADVDMYRFTVSAGQRIAFDINTASSGLNSVIRLFNSSGTQLSSNDNAAAPGETLGTDSWLQYTFTTAGTYFVGVSGTGNITYSASTGAGDRISSKGAYTLTASVVDPDDQQSESASLGTLLGKLARTGSIETVADVDSYRFSASAGQTVGVDITHAAGSSLDSYLRLFDASGNELAANDNAAGPGETLGVDSWLTFSLTSSGTYYVFVSSAGNEVFDPATGNDDQTGNSSGGYALTVTYLDSDDQNSEATSIGAVTATTTATGSIAVGPDVSLYSLSVAAGQTLSFDIDADSGTPGFDSALRLFSASGVQLLINDNAAAPGETLGGESYFTYTFTSGGTYFIGVSGAGNTKYSATTGLGDTSGSTGNYLLTVTPVDNDDQTTEAVSLGTLLSAVSRTSSIEIPLDVDFYQITVAAGQKLGVDVDASNGSGLNSLIRLFGADGAELASNDDAAAPGATADTDSYLEYDVAASGILYVAVSSSGNTAFDPVSGDSDSGGTTSGGYVLTLQSLDGDDQLTEAQSLGALTADTTVTGTVGYSADVNLIQFSVVANQKLAFDVDQTGADWNSYLRLFDSAGKQIAANDNAAAPGEALGKEPWLQYTFTKAGTYYAGVSGYGNSSYTVIDGLGDKAGGTGDYTLTLSPVDADDQMSEAVNLGSISTITSRVAAIEISSDVDLYRVSAVAGQRLSFDLDTPVDSTLDTQLRLFDAAGVELAANNDATAPGETSLMDSWLQYDVTVSGAYYIGVSASGNAAYDVTDGAGDSGASSSGKYLLFVSFDDPDDQLSEAVDLGAMTAAQTVTNSIVISNDVNVVKFTVVGGQKVAFDVDVTNGSTLDSYLRLFDSTGKQIAANDNAAAPGESVRKEAYLLQTFATSGTYFAAVSATANQLYSPVTGSGDKVSTTNAVGGYTLTLSVIDSDDQLSEAPNMGSITSFVKRDDSILTTDDVDIFRFSATAGQHLTFDIDAASGSALNSYLRLFDSTGTELATNDDGVASGETAGDDSFLDYTFTSAGTYHIAVSSNGNQAFNPTTGAGDSAGSVGGYSLIVQVFVDNGGFNIDLTFSGLTTSQQAIFQEAANIWSSIIIGDLPDVTYNGQTIDDLRISATAIAIDGPYGILGQAGPTMLRGGSSLPFLGQMQFDTADLARMEAAGQLRDVIVHEMGHVLGIGTIWSRLGLLSGAGTSNPIFIGAQATAAYNRIFGTNAAGVPVENGGGAGTRDAHWRESVLGLEIMSGYLSAQNKLTEITIGSLADLGYLVDISFAELYPLS